MKVITSYVCPPIPVRSADWEAYLDCHDGDENAPRGRGVTRLDALEDLICQIDDGREYKAVADAINDIHDSAKRYSDMSMGR